MGLAVGVLVGVVVGVVVVLGSGDDRVVGVAAVVASLEVLVLLGR